MTDGPQAADKGLNEKALGVEAIAMTMRYVHPTPAHKVECGSAIS